MRLFGMTISKPFEVAVGASRRHFALATTPGARVNILYSAPVNAMMRVCDRMVRAVGGHTLQHEARERCAADIETVSGASRQAWREGR